MKKLKKIILKYTPNKIKKIFEVNVLKELKEENKYANISYSQEGEDLILERFFGDKKDGFFIDVGAHHPKRFSNTYKFYLKGWRGINIDAMPGSMELFNKLRPKDINLEVGVSKIEGDLMYYIFNEPALNTFSEKEALKKDGLRNFKIIEKRKIKTLPLSKILDEYVVDNKKIEFVSIDVEGLDLEVLESNNWDKFRPNFILVEDLKKNELLELPKKSDIYKKLESLNYKLMAKTYNTLFFKDVRYK